MIIITANKNINCIYIICYGVMIMEDPVHLYLVYLLIMFGLNICEMPTLYIIMYMHGVVYSVDYNSCVSILHL